MRPQNASLREYSGVAQIAVSRIELNSEVMVLLERGPSLMPTHSHSEPAKLWRKVSLASKCTCAIFILRKARRTPSPKWRKLGVTITMRRQLGDHIQAVRAERDASQVHMPTKAAAAEDDAAELPYWAQGDSEMYSAEKLQERYQLRNHPVIVSQLQCWWVASRHSMNTEEGMPKATLSKAGYLTLMVKLYKVRLAHLPGRLSC